MPTPGYVNLANVLVASTGTGAIINLGTAVTGWKTWADAGAVNGQTYFYEIEASDGSRHEIGTAVFDSAVPRFTGRTVIASSEVANAPLNLTLTDRIFSGPTAAGMFPSSLPESDDFTWYPSGTASPGGSTYGGMVDLLHAAIGNYADIDVVTFAPGDVTNTYTAPSISTLILDDFLEGDLSTSVIGGFVAPMAIYNGYRHIGAGSATLVGLDFAPTNNSDSTGSFGALGGANFQFYNYGSGFVQSLYGFAGYTENSGDAEVIQMWGINARAVQNGTASSSVVDLFGIEIIVENSGAGTVDNAYGLYVDDVSGVGSSVSENIRSKGASSLNNFEGFLVLGSTVVGSLPAAAAGNTGWRYFVTDALAPVFGATVAGSGAVKVPVYSDGTNWKVG